MNYNPLFKQLNLRNIVLKNRIIRSATYEGWGDPTGVPQPGLGDLYATLARGGVGALITGFVYVSAEGRAMQKRQCAMDRDAMIEPWRQIVGRAKEAAADLKIFMQLAHTGRQTRREITGREVLGVSSKKCSYFRQSVRPLDTREISRIIDDFAQAARRAQQAGFDGIQIHAAHGYLIHQFLSPLTNRRRDEWADRPLFLEQIVKHIRGHCGSGFPVLVKLSAMEDTECGIRLSDTIQTIERLKPLQVDAWEISYGTMEYALNIIRGALPWDTAFEINPLLSGIPKWLRTVWKKCFMRQYVKRIMPFSEGYNIPSAAEIKRRTGETVLAVGGLHSASVMRDSLTLHGLDAVCICRPLICEPDFPEKIRLKSSNQSACTKCNLCLIHCDGTTPLRCYGTSVRKHGD
ncbi:MAG TPA: NADH:flavin oxidoreductase [Syntrophorhabdaceae bacterium]|nr:NADH:flavin oxidoreductase [Syntrophorhabdaceae bacterium]